MFSLFRPMFRFSQQFNKAVYVNGKSALTISQMIGGSGRYLNPFLDNFYIKMHTQQQVLHDKSISPEILDNQTKLLGTVLQKDLLVRFESQIDGVEYKQIEEKPYSKSSNPIALDQSVQIQCTKNSNCIAFFVYYLQNSHIHLDQSGKILQKDASPQDHKQFKQEELPVHQAMHGRDKIKEEVWIDKDVLVHDVEEHLRKNIVELEKLFIDGLGLDLSFMLSRRNLHHPIVAGEKQKKNLWLNCISNKSKAIHSNIIQNGISLADTIHQQGYQLHHLFLSSFNDSNNRITYLEDNKAYNLRQIVYILSMINFNGKLVLDCQDPAVGTPEEFERNIAYLDKVLKEIGYKKKVIGEMDDDSYISAL